MTAQFVDPSGTYTGGYTSDAILPNTSRGQRGVVQVVLSTGTVMLQGKVAEAAPFLNIKEYTASTLDEVVMTPYMRVVVSDDSDGLAWMSETN